MIHPDRKNKRVEMSAEERQSDEVSKLIRKLRCLAPTKAVVCNARAYLDATISLNCAITAFGVSPMRAISVRTASPSIGPKSRSSTPRWARVRSPADRASTWALPRFPSETMFIGRSTAVCLDNGMYKIWFARNYRTQVANTLLLDNALATMGAGLSSAMMAAMLYPSRRVLAVCGDGGFMMNSQELVSES